MIKAKQVNIKKNKCFTVDISDLDPFLLDIKNKSFKDIDIYYINYIQENFNSSNPLSIKINSVTGYFKEKNNDKYLILKATEYYWKNKEAIKEKARNRYRNLSEEEKNKIKEYQKNKYQELL